MCLSLPTWGSVDGQVPEVAALDELHRHASRGGVVGEAHQQLGDAAVGQRLGGRGAVALGHGGQTKLGVHTLTTYREGNTGSSSSDFTTAFCCLIYISMAEKPQRY